MGFKTEYKEMNLVKISENGYIYTDKFGQVIYWKLQNTPHLQIQYTQEDLQTMMNMGIETKDLLEMSNQIIPHYGVYTRPEGSAEFSQIGIVSQYYQFTGHEFLNEKIRKLICNMENPKEIFKERPFVSFNLAWMQNEIIIKNPKRIEDEGKIYPVIIVKNNYQGTGAIQIQFGLYMEGYDGCDYGFGFKQKINSLYQRHLTGASTILGNYIDDYVETFSVSIEEMIQNLFNQTIDDRKIMKTLDFIEKIGGKKRRKNIAEAITSQKDNSQSTNFNGWDYFQVLSKFSAEEYNISIKSYLNNMVERVIELPPKMLEMIGRMK
jgi:hypothetical protein